MSKIAILETDLKQLESELEFSAIVQITEIWSVSPFYPLQNYHHAQKPTLKTMYVKNGGGQVEKIHQK